MSAVVNVEGLTKRYPKRGAKGTVTAVDDVSFSVRRGEVTGLLGPNGAGKTTTIKTICGLLRPDAGRVSVCGVDNQRQRLRALRHISAVLEGNRNLYWRLTVRENLFYFAGNRGVSVRAVRPTVERLLAQFRLEDKANELVNNLSRGMQQKLAIAVALCAGTEVVLLDEPTLGLDVETGLEVRALLAEVAREGRTVIISTHDMALVQALCKHVVIISRGRVVADSSVGELLGLFETRAYRVVLGAPLTPAQEGRLARFGARYEVAEAPTLELTLEHPEDLYDLIDTLKAARTPIESLSRTEMDFERVFLELVGRDAMKGLVREAAVHRG